MLQVLPTPHRRDETPDGEGKFATLSFIKLVNMGTSRAPDKDCVDVGSLLAAGLRWQWDLKAFHWKQAHYMSFQQIKNFIGQDFIVSSFIQQARASERHAVVWIAIIVTSDWAWYTLK